MYSFNSSSGASKSGAMYVIIPLHSPGPGRDGLACFGCSPTSFATGCLKSPGPWCDGRCGAVS